MRRLSSISLIVVLLWSVLSPASAAVHQMTGTREVCHGTKAVHHCEAMQQDEDQGDAPVLAVTSNSPKCPMDCCTHSYQNSGMTVATAFGLPTGLVTDRIVSSASSVFAHNGFSSHTDRGPPSV